MIKKAVITAVMICFMLFPHMAYAAEEQPEQTIDSSAEMTGLTIEEAVDMYGIDEADSGLKNIGRENGIDDFSLKDTVVDMLSGEYEFSLSDILEKILGLIAGQAADVIYIMKRIVILVLLSAMLETLASSFSSDGVSKLGQYICTAVIIVTVMQSFSYAAQAATDAVDTISGISTTLQPLYMLIMTANGRAAEMSAAVPVLYAAAAFINFAVKKFVVPAILLSALITFINSMSERDMLLELADLMSTLCKWGVRICAGAFVFIMSLIKIGIPDVAVIAGKSIKTAASAVPVVGGLMASAAETAAGLVSSIGNSITAAVMVFIVLASIAPVIRLAAIMIIYKLTAAVTEPVASKRIVKCISKAADYTAVLTGVVFTAEIMFITVTALMLAV